MRWLLLMLVPSLAMASPWPPTVGELPESLQPLYDEAVRYPDDYGALSRLGAAAEQAGEPALSLAAWTRAAEVSDGNLESSLARIGPLLTLGDQAGATDAVASLVAAHPDSAAVALAEARVHRAHWSPMIAAERTADA
ncbi:MAG: hypothetical protein KC620_15405, partial [Myxococcales bacterium]|nr:hypothetical protein [Myxococcales bacterium]